MKASPRPHAADPEESILSLSAERCSMLLRVACIRCNLASLWTDEPRCFLATVCRDSRRCEAILLDERFHGVGWLPPSPELEESPLPSP